MLKALSAGLLLVVVGCYPDRLSTSNYDMVITTYDTAASFTAATYFLRDTVVHLVPPGGTDDITRLFDNQIITQVRTNMQARGYISLPDTNGADLHVAIAVSTTEYTGYYWNYWCDIWYGYYGCYYPPYWGTYSYTLGTLFVTIGDRRQVGAGGKRELIWIGLANGLAGQGSTAARLTSGIDQMFAQSPYIKSH